MFSPPTFRTTTQLVEEHRLNNEKGYYQQTRKHRSDIPSFENSLKYKL